MEAPPLTLSVLHLRPSTLLLPADEPAPPASPLPAEPVAPIEPLPVFSPTHSYPAPYPSTTLGSTISLSLDLANTSRNGPVKGVRMMCEVQSPNGRYRLGEIVHGAEEDENGEIVEPATMPELAMGESVRLDVEGEVNDLGLGVIIVSVAWETDDGRRTMQRFFKYNVNPPLAIKTRIHQTQHPNTALDLVKREEVYLEILAQNVAVDGMVFDRVYLEPVHGLISKRIASTDSASVSTEDPSDAGGEDARTLLPGETRQYLFLLSPSASEAIEGDTAKAEDRAPQSTFPPHHAPGTILPLGRLDLTWRSGRAHDPGRLQTSTLNRRIPVAPIAPTRTLSAAPPTPGSRLSSPRPAASGTRPDRTDEPAAPVWEFDLIVSDRAKEVPVEKEFEVTLRVGVRSRASVEEAEGEDEESSASASAPSRPVPPIIAVQHLSRPARPHALPSKTDTDSSLPGPKFLFSPPSRAGTPASAVTAPAMTRTGSAASTATAGQRPFSPLSQVSQSAASRPMTPVSSQLRQATASHIGSPSSASLPLLPVPESTSATSFPPPPTLPPLLSQVGRDERGMIRGDAQPLGASMTILPERELQMVEEKAETTYADPIAPPRRWEAVYEHKLRFFAVDEGLAELGGLRLLVLDDQEGLARSTGREWESLGDVWVTA